MSFNINMKQPQKPKIRIKNEPTVNDSIGFDGNALSQKPKEVTNVEFGNTARDNLLEKKIDDISKEVNDLDVKIDNEISQAIDEVTSGYTIADAQLKSELEDEIAHIDLSPLENAIEKETNDRELADTNLQNQINSKQNNLTAGSNIQITNDVISATDTTYDAGSGLTLTGTTFSVDTTTIATKQDVSNEETARGNADTRIEGKIDNHIANTSNPHSVTKEQVGLGNVANTGDSATPLENGTTKFTTGGAYTLKTNLEQSISDEATARQTQDGILQNSINTKVGAVNISNQLITDWSINEDQEYSDYTYKSSTTIQDLVGAKFVNVSFSLEQLESNNICPIQVVDIDLGTLTIYSKESDPLTIPYITIIK